jgi:hypothetical protein
MKIFVIPPETPLSFFLSRAAINPAVVSVTPGKFTVEVFGLNTPPLFFARVLTERTPAVESTEIGLTRLVTKKEPREPKISVFLARSFSRI